MIILCTRDVNVGRCDIGANSVWFKTSKRARLQYSLNCFLQYIRYSYYIPLTQFSLRAQTYAYKNNVSSASVRNNSVVRVYTPLIWRGIAYPNIGAHNYFLDHLDGYTLISTLAFILHLVQIGCSARNFCIFNLLNSCGVASLSPRTTIFQKIRCRLQGWRDDFICARYNLWAKLC